MIKNLKRFITFYILAMLFPSCYGQNLPYQLDKPSEAFTLTKELDEISGLHAISDSILVAVQDEKGIIYHINANNGEIIKSIKFAKDGDFEGITAYNNKLYALESNGSIYKVKKDDTKKYKFEKDGKFDFEGLCIDTKNKQLLIACKTHPNKDKKKHIYIYGFDLKENKYIKSPVYKIKKEGIYKRFKPSGIAIHPDGSIYLLSSTAKMILRLSKKGEVLQAQPLSPLIFNQPEGITFTENSDLYISNEKRKWEPTLLKFTTNE